MPLTTLTPIMPLSSKQIQQLVQKKMQYIFAFTYYLIKFAITKGLIILFTLLLTFKKQCV